MSDSEDMLKKLKSIRRQLRNRFAIVESTDDLPKPWGGSGIVHLNVDPETAFHFLEFVFEIAYVDIMQEAGFRFIDDKTTWEYFVMSKNGFLRIYDWKRYKVSVGSFGLKSGGTDKGLEKDAAYLKQLIEDNIRMFEAYKQADYQNLLEQYPLDNFMNAFISLTILFRVADGKLEKGHNYIEALILLVSLLDTQLRYAILLTRINNRKSKNIDPDLKELFEQKGSNYIAEREVFKLAEKEVSFPEYDKALFFKRINELYDIRNRAVHRFAITNFQYTESKQAVKQYKDLVDALFDIIKGLEKQQVELGVGFITQDQLDLPEHEMRREIGKAIGSKIDTRAVVPRLNERVPMFSDDYPDGYHPALKEVIEKMNKEFEERDKRQKDK